MLEFTMSARREKMPMLVIPSAGRRPPLFVPS
jgi:hypothetical protein